ncbi:MAG: SusC/RagA family TonB-linked outer membrane protein [Gemmatimonadota bacterium]|nr:SusC/RagA family TonB-linked outer membrane protein [Gemmatimonadota bacterium]
MRASPFRASRMLLAAMLLAPATLLAQGSITGRVIDRTAGIPIVGVRVIVTNTTLATTTNPEGRYTLRNVPAGPQTVRALRVGFVAQSRPVTVEDGRPVTADFTMEATVVRLQEMVTTATGPQRRIEVGNAVANLGDVTKSVETAPVTSISDLLVGKSPGVSVLQGNMTGSTPVIKIRGLNSLSLSNDPIYVIDGVRMNSGNTSVGFTGTRVSYLDQLDPNEIQSVEIVKGPSAATLYGTDAANGVIVITTRKGQEGPTRWSWFGETGVVDDRNTYPTQYADWGHDPTTLALKRCVLVTVGQGTCVVDSTTSFNALRNPSTTPLQLGNRKEVGMNASGGNAGVRFFVSGDVQNEVGPFHMPVFAQQTLDSMGTAIRSDWLDPEAFQSENFRTNLSATLTPSFDLNVNAGYVNTNQRLPQADNNIFSVYYSAYNGPGFNYKSTAPSSSGLAYNPTGSLGENKNGYGVYSPAQIFQYVPKSGTQRFIGSSDGNWRPLDWMTNRASVGLDLAGRNDFRLCQFGQCPNSGTTRQGLVFDQQTYDRNMSAKLSSTSTWHALSWAVLKTTFGADYNNLEEDFVQANGTLLPPGAQNVNQAAIKNASTELQTVNKTLGLYGQEEFAFRDKMFITVALRTDQNSAFGTNFQRVYYPKASLSWLLTDETWFRHPGFVNSFRLRSAYGASGVQPGAVTALQTFNALTTNLAVNTGGSATGTDTPGLVAAALGNPALKPERSTEFEGGFESQLFANRVNVDFTYYNKKTSDALIAQPIAASAGPSSLTVTRNLGSVANSGLELQVTTTVVSTENFGWDLTVGGSHNTNKILSLGLNAQGQPNPTIGTGTTRDSIGLSVNGFFAHPYTFADKNGDGIITPDEVTVSPKYAYYGYSQPRDIVSIQNGFDLFKRAIHIQALLDYRGGASLNNNSVSFYCQQTSTCNDETLKGTSLAAQARLVALRYENPSTAAGYLENGQFWRLREVSATVNLPSRFAHSIRAQDASILFAGRNLHVWTKYTGVDPEANYSVGDVQTDFSTTAPRTYYIARVNLHY